MFEQETILTRDFVAECVDNIRTTGNIILINGNEITVSSIAGLSVNDYIVIGDNSNIRITAINGNTLTVQTPSTISGTTFKTAAPYFEAGKPLMIANLLKEKGRYNKYPLVVMFEPVKQKIIQDLKIPWGAESNPLLLLCHPINFDDDSVYSDEQHEKVIKPILIDNIYKKLIAEFNRKSANLTGVEHTIETHPNFGLKPKMKTVANILPEFLGAIWLDVDLKIYKKLNCNT